MTSGCAGFVGRIRRLAFSTGAEFARWQYLLAFRHLGGIPSRARGWPPSHSCWQWWPLPGCKQAKRRGQGKIERRSFPVAGAAAIVPGLDRHNGPVPGRRVAERNRSEAEWAMPGKTSNAASRNARPTWLAATMPFAMEPRTPAGREKFRDLLESAPDAMVIVDCQRRDLLSTPRQKSYSAISGRKCGSASRIFGPGRFTSSISSIVINYHDPEFRPMGVGMELHGRHKEGHEFPVEISLSRWRRRGQSSF